MRAYGAIELTVASPPQSFTEPLSLDEIMYFLHVEQSSPPDLGQEDMLETMIIAARELAEVAQGRDLTAKQYDLSLDFFAGSNMMSQAPHIYSSGLMFNFGTGYGNEIELRSPLQSVDLVQYINSDGAVFTLTENTDYLVDKNRSLIITPYGKMWPFFTARPSSAVTIRFTSGFPSNHPFWSNAGQRILMGMKMLISSWHENRIPFEPVRHIEEYPYAVTRLFETGAYPMVR